MEHLSTQKNDVQGNWNAFFCATENVLIINIQKRSNATVSSKTESVGKKTLLSLAVKWADTIDWYFTFK